MYNDICSMLKRTDKIWSSKGVVNEEWNTMLVSNSCNAFKVDNVRVRVAECLGIYYFSIRLDCCLESVKVVYVDDGVADTLSREGVGDEVVAATVKIVGCYDVVTSLYDVLESVCDGCCTRGNSETCYTTFKGSYTVFEYTLCRVGQATVYITCIAKSETVGCMLRVMEYVTCSLINRHSA